MNAVADRNQIFVTAAQRARRERIRAFHFLRGQKLPPGEYRCPSFTTRGQRPARWFTVRVVKVWRSSGIKLQVICNHPVVMGYIDRRDDYGNSTCKHAAEVGLRLLRLPHEVDEIPDPAKPDWYDDPFKGL